MTKICPCCGSEHDSHNELCGYCQDFVEEVSTVLEDKWCPHCGSVTNDDVCPACGYIFGDYEAYEALRRLVA